MNGNKRAFCRFVLVLLVSFSCFGASEGGGRKGPQVRVLGDLPVPSCCESQVIGCPFFLPLLVFESARKTAYWTQSFSVPESLHTPQIIRRRFLPSTPRTNMLISGFQTRGVLGEPLPYFFSTLRRCIASGDEATE